MNILEAGRRSGLGPDTIRFYERKGVLPRPPRRENGYRDYSEQHVATLGLVRGLRHLEMSLAEMRGIALVAHDATCGDLRSTLIEQLEGVLDDSNTRIQEIEHTRSHVSALLSGLRRMRPSERRGPGAMPCGCVELLGAEDEAPDPQR